MSFVKVIACIECGQVFNDVPAGPCDDEGGCMLAEVAIPAEAGATLPGPRSPQAEPAIAEPVDPRGPRAPGQVPRGWARW